MCIKPTEKHLEYMDWELGAFLHFGIRTFNESNRDWDYKQMDPATFNPVELDCEEWARQLKACGVKYAVLTTKHHDGFALWQTDTTEFSVKNSPFRGGKGDVVREYTDAMRKAGIKVGLYYSSSQFDAKTTHGISYSDFVVSQVSELLSRYGKIDIIWFDGCGSNGDVYDTEKIVKTIYELQPEIRITGFGENKDFRWVGNEWGLAHMKNCNEVETVELDITHSGKALKEKKFLPAECDACMVRNDSENFWFYSETFKDCLRTKEEIIGMYYYSIGRGANLLINIGPDRKGHLQASNVEILQYMHDEMNRRFSECSLKPEKIEKTENEYRISFDRAYLFDQLMLKEDLSDGQKIREFTVYVSPYQTPGRLAVYKGCTVGHKLICTFPPIRGKCIDIVFDDASDGAKLSDILPMYVSGKQIFQINKQ